MRQFRVSSFKFQMLALALLMLTSCQHREPLMVVAPMALAPEKCLPGDTNLIQHGQETCVPELRDLLRDYNHFPACEWPNNMPCAEKI